MFDGPVFVGCASNRKFVQHTAVMLTSLDLNGDLLGAPIILAGFNLQDQDRAVLQAAAGRSELRIVTVTRDMLNEARPDRFHGNYPLSVVGRLLLADYVEKSGARMVTLDSDMIVNGSLRPLVERDLGEVYFAACRDPLHLHMPSYFNSGLTMFDVDPFRRDDIGHRCLRWIGNQENQPGFPDNDALNVIIGHNWHRLARTWNYFNWDALGFVTEDYEMCRVAHFAGPKPWNHADHVGLPVYEHYFAQLLERLDVAGLQLQQ